MRKLITTMMLGATLAGGAVTPALADNDRRERREERWERKEDRMKERYKRQRERLEDRRERAERRDDWREWRRYDHNRVDPRYGNYYADRYYRDGRYYQPRRLSYNDRIYRGHDGRYYCRRPDGTTGLIVGALGGGVLGNVIAPGGSKTLGTIIGAVGGGLIGREIERGNASCR